MNKAERDKAYYEKNKARILAKKKADRAKKKNGNALNTTNGTLETNKTPLNTKGKSIPHLLNIENQGQFNGTQEKMMFLFILLFTIASSFFLIQEAIAFFLSVGVSLPYFKGILPELALIAVSWFRSYSDSKKALFFQIVLIVLSITIISGNLSNRIYQDYLKNGHIDKQNEAIIADRQQNKQLLKVYVEKGWLGEARKIRESIKEDRRELKKNNLSSPKEVLIMLVELFFRVALTLINVFFIKALSSHLSRREKTVSRVAKSSPDL